MGKYKTNKKLRNILKKRERQRDPRFVQKAVALENGGLDISDRKGQRVKLVQGVADDLALPWRRPDTFLQNRAQKSPEKKWISPYEEKE